MRARYTQQRDFIVTQYFENYQSLTVTVHRFRPLHQL